VTVGASTGAGTPARPVDQIKEMSMRVLPVLIAAVVAVAVAMPAEAAKKKAKKNSGLMTQSVASQDAATEQLNQQSLNMARSGQNALTPGQRDTTQNLNAMSERAASQGRNMNSAPMPFR